jgi:two-component system LytT family response regulator
MGHVVEVHERPRLTRSITPLPGRSGLRVLIVDDQASGRAALSGFLRGRGDVERVDAARSGSEAITRLRVEAYDVILVDIRAPEAGVKCLLEELRAIPDRVPSLVFVRAHGEAPTVEGLAPESLGSPQERMRLDGTLHLGCHRPLPNGVQDDSPRTGPDAARDCRIGIKSEGRILLVDLRQVISVEAQGRYVLLQGGGWVHVLRETISAMAEKLKGFGFVRIHRSALVNTAFVREIKPYSTGHYGVRVEGDREYSVTLAYRGNLRSLAALWIGTDFARAGRRARSDRRPSGHPLREPLHPCSAETAETLD